MFRPSERQSKICPYIDSTHDITRFRILDLTQGDGGEAGRRVLSVDNRNCLLGDLELTYGGTHRLWWPGPSERAAMLGSHASHHCERTELCVSHELRRGRLRAGRPPALHSLPAEPGPGAHCARSGRRDPRLRSSYERGGGCRCLRGHKVMRPPR